MLSCHIDRTIERHREAVAGGFDQPFPKPEDFGLDAEFTKAEFEAEQGRLRDTAKKFIFLIVFALATPVGFWLYSLADSKFEFWFLFVLGCALSLGALFGVCEKHIENCNPTRQAHAFFDASEKWLQSLNDWHESRSETGLRYWLEKRGVEFEIAVMRMLEKRGLKVEMTKGSGDGGVDLKVSFGSTTWFCQCKGHAKPISVAPVREIAGVCSRSAEFPVIFSANGFTKPAYDAALALGVVPVDGYALIGMAKRADLAHMGWIEHQAGSVRTIRV